MSRLDGAEPRAVCSRCRRAQSVCYCKHLTSIPTRTRIAFLQHTRERGVAIGTARMASLCLPNSELHVGVDWVGSPALARVLGDPERPPALLFPGDDAIDITRDPPIGPITLVVVDGTWRQVKKVVRKQGGQTETTVYIESHFETHRVVDGRAANENAVLHLRDGMERIATVRIGEPLGGDLRPAVQYPLADHLGSAGVTLDDAGATVSREEYTPYGETSFGSFARQRYRFAGKERDEESGLVYQGARRWTSGPGPW